MDVMSQSPAGASPSLASTNEVDDPHEPARGAVPDGVDPHDDAAPHPAYFAREGRPARRAHRAQGWLDEALRPRVFTPPTSRSAVQAHSTGPDEAGQPLPQRVRARMERALGGDLSSARVHMQAACPADDERALAIAKVLARLTRR